MTEAITITKPHLMPLDCVGIANDEAHVNLKALPLGSVIRQYFNDDHDDDNDCTAWVKQADGYWVDVDDSSDRTDSEVFSGDRNFIVHSVPHLTSQAALLLDEGAMVWCDGSGSLSSGPWQLTTVDRSINADQVWRFRGGSNNDERNGIIMTNTVYGRFYPITPSVVVAEAPTLPWAAIQPGMLVSPMGNEQIMIYVVSMADGMWSALNWYKDSERPASKAERAASLYPTYILNRQDPSTMALVKAALASTEADAGVVQEAVREARNEVERKWARIMERLNDSAHEYARDNSLCSEFDNFMSEHTEIGLSPRERDYRVQVPIEGYITVSVSASSEEAAEEQAVNSVGIREYREYTLGDYEFYVNSVDTDSTTTMLDE